MEREVHHIRITQAVRRSSNLPTHPPPYQHINCQSLPVHPEFHPDTPRSHPRIDFLLTPPTSHPRAIVVPPPPPPPQPHHHISEIECRLVHFRIRSSSTTSSNRSASPPLTRSISPCSSSSRSSSTNSRRSVRFEDTPSYAPPPERTATEGNWEYVSSRGMSYHLTEFAGQSGHSERDYADRETLVIEKARRGGRERKRRQGNESHSRYL